MEKKSYYRLNKIIIDRRTNILIIFFSLSIIMVFTFHPYDFRFKETYSNLGYNFLLLGWGKSDILDVLENIILFLPFGFGLTGYITQTMKLGGVTSLIMIILASFGVSYAIEVLQVFQPLRFSSLIDTLSNGAGGILGFLCFLLLDLEFKIAHYNSAMKAKTLQLIFLGYAIFVILISISIQKFSGFSNWDKTFHLLIGNERTGDRPWRGYISEIYIANRAISEKEIAQISSKKKTFDSIEKSLLTSYQLTGIGNYHDKTGHLSGLVWRGKTQQDIQHGEGLYLGPNHWLETAFPAVYLTQSLIETSQFTLSVTVATGDTMQTGPARIISLSEDTNRSNFTLGQSGSDLIFRLRTPLTGENGTNPHLIVPDIFSTTNPHNLIITYNGSDLLLYVEGVHNSRTLKFNPGTILLSHLFRLNTFNMMVFKALYYALVFIPLGILMTLTVKIMRRRFVAKMLIICGSILLLSFIIEYILVNVSGRGMEFENLLISMLFMTIPYAFLSMNYSFARKKLGYL